MDRPPKHADGWGGGGRRGKKQVWYHFYVLKKKKEKKSNILMKSYIYINIYAYMHKKDLTVNSDL